MISRLKNSMRAPAAVLLLALPLGLPLAGCSGMSLFPYKSATKAADKVLDDIFPGNGNGNGNGSASSAAVAAAVPAAPAKKPDAAGQ